MASQAPASTSRWDAADYASAGAFVPELGMAALDLLDPKEGERILDVGCGDGALSVKMIERGAEVVGVDSSESMVEAARAAGVYAEVLDAADMDYDREFDAAFSNAALHWMREKDRVAEAIFNALRLGGRFAGEMGGEGNLERLRSALDAEMQARGFEPPVAHSNWYPSVAEFEQVYAGAGFVDIAAERTERATDLPHGVASWVTTFRRGWLDQAGVPEEERADLAQAVATRFGSDTADYVRLRFTMRRPG